MRDEKGRLLSLPSCVVDLFGELVFLLLLNLSGVLYVDEQNCLVAFVVLVSLVLVLL